jgi:hypothetical protein
VVTVVKRSCADTGEASHRFNTSPLGRLGFGSGATVAAANLVF